MSPSQSASAAAQEIESLRYLTEGLNEEGDELRSEIADLQLQNRKLLLQVAALEEEKEAMVIRAEAQQRDHGNIVPRFEAMKAERSKWQQQIAELKLEVNCLSRDSESYKKSHKELQDLRSLVQNVNNPKHQTMAKIAHLEKTNTELEERATAAEAARDEAVAELQYMKGRLNEWTYYEHEGEPKGKPGPNLSEALGDLPAEQQQPAGKGQFFGDKYETMLGDEHKSPRAPVQNRKINFSANLGSKGNWFKGSK